MCSAWRPSAEEVSSHTTGLGLAHVRDRLYHYDGERCQLTIESEVGSGTTVRLLLPPAGLPVESGQGHSCAAAERQETLTVATLRVYYLRLGEWERLQPQPSY